MENKRLKLKVELALSELTGLVNELFNEIDSLEEEVEQLKDALQYANYKIEELEED